MKKPSPSSAASRPTSSPRQEPESTAAKRLGGQPENDADARAAGVDSATSPDQNSGKSRAGKSRK